MWGGSTSISEKTGSMLCTSFAMTLPFNRQLKQGTEQLFKVPVDKCQSQALKLAVLAMAGW